MAMRDDERVPASAAHRLRHRSGRREHQQSLGLGRRASAVAVADGGDDGRAREQRVVPAATQRRQRLASALRSAVGQSQHTVHVRVGLRKARVPTEGGLAAARVAKEHGRLATPDGRERVHGGGVCSEIVVGATSRLGLVLEIEDSDL